MASGATVLPTGVIPPDSFNALQGLGMLNIRPTGPPAGQAFAAPGANPPRFQALGLSMLGGTDPFASAFGAPAGSGGMDGWSSGVPQSNPFAPPAPAGEPSAAGMAFGEQTGAFGRQPASSSRLGRAVGGGKRGPGQAPPGPSPGGEGGGGQHSKGDKKHGKGNNNNNNHGKGKGDRQKNGGGKNQGKQAGRGKKDTNGAAAPSATPRPAGSKGENSDGKAQNNNRKGGSRRGDKAKPKGDAPPPPQAGDAARGSLQRQQGG